MSRSIDAIALYRELCDLVAEAVAVDTVIGRPETLVGRLTTLRDLVGAMKRDIPANTSQASRDVLEERQRHISGEGWSPVHDDAHDDGSLGAAAAAYALAAADILHPQSQGDSGYESSNPPPLWPDGWAFKASDPRRMLVKSAALAIAEIERLDRAHASRPLDLDATSRAFVRAYAEAEHAEWTGMKRVYIAGPMTGLPDLNFPAFHSQAARYRARGIEVVNPAEINADPNAKWVDCMRADIRELVRCDGIVMLPGWDRSKGATLEHHIALSLELRVMYLP